VIADATTPWLTAQAIAFNEVGRRAILEDPDFHAGDYYDTPAQPDAGLGIARMVGHITYLSDVSMHEKFGRRLREGGRYAYDFVHEFEVETYLAHQGRRFIDRFDANTYLYMTKAMDYFDLAAEAPSLAAAVGDVPSRFLVTSFSSDWLFPTYQARELVNALLVAGKQVTFAEIESPYGHDAFLLEVDQQAALVSPFLDNAVAACRAAGRAGVAS
jgi:homoserine O-acetyltransferase